MTLNKIGEALYGERWQSTLARDLGLNLRTMQRWAAEETLASQLPDGVRRDLRKAALKRRGQMAAVLSSNW